MLITRETDSNAWQVELKERTMADIRARSGEAKNEAFPAVAKISALNQSLYDLFVAPVVRQMATEETAEKRRQMHPLRLRRTLVSDKNPLMAPVAGAGRAGQAEPPPGAPRTTPSSPGKGSGPSGVERSLDTWRDWRDAWTEIAFHGVYGWLAAVGVAGGETPEEAPSAACWPMRRKCARRCRASPPAAMPRRWCG